MDCMLIWGFVTTIRNNSSTARGHAVRQTSEQLLVECLPLFLQHSLNFICRTCESCFNSRLEYAPQILNGVEVRRVGREINDVDSMVVKPTISQVGLVLRCILLLKPPMFIGIEMKSSLNEIVLQDVYVARCIELTDEYLRLPNSFCTEASPEGDTLGMRRML